MKIPRPRRLLLSIGAAVTLIATASIFVVVRFRERDPFERLASIESSRTIAGRLADLPWRRFHLERGAPASASHVVPVDVLAAAGAVLADTHDDAGPSALRARANALVLTGRFVEAIEILEKAAKSGDARAWNDLAVAYHASATAQDRPSQLILALTAADRALRIDSRLTAALFNRALILEGLGDSRRARSAWDAFLTAETQQDWIAEARSHQSALAPKNHATDFAREVRDAAAAFARGDSARVARLVSSSPQQARSWAEGPLLAQWAEAFESGDEHAATRQLAFVRELARALRAQNGEQLPADAVAAIDESTAARRAALARAHRIYDAARAKYSRRQPREAEPELARAAELFSSSNSPLAQVARYFQANTVFDQNRTAESQQMLRELLSSLAADRHPALEAQVRWQLARCEIVDGSWSAALESCGRSMELFERLGEQSNRAFVKALAADVFDYSGDPQRAWAQRIAALRALDREGAAAQVRTLISNCVRAAIRNGDPSAALSFANLAIEHLQEVSDPLLMADAQIQRARLAATAADERTDELIRGARAAISRIPDAALRARSEADLSVAEGIRAARARPEEAIALLTGAIDFYAALGYDAWIIDAYLQRARAYALAGDDSRALADLEAGIRELERQRATVTDARARAFFFDREPALFEELTALHLRHSDVNRAFAAAERARARTLRELLGPAALTNTPALGDVQMVLPRETALVELAFTSTDVVVFAITAEGAKVARTGVTGGEVRSMIEAHRYAVVSASADRARVTGTALHDLLFAPLRPHLARARELIIVGDRDLDTVIWPALTDRNGRFLIEDFAISSAPSAAFLLREPRRAYEGPALIVGNPAAPGYPALPHAEREAVALARRYAGATLLVGRQATRDAFRAAANDSSIIHIASHAEADDDRPPAIRLTPGKGDDGSLDANDISGLHLHRARVVVVAACSTAAGRPSHVEGVPSLGRAFLAAGASAVLATRWDIDDEAAASLFGTFHDRLLAGDSPARAAQVAQLSALRSAGPDRQHARTWAALTVLDATRQERSRSRG